MCLILQRRCQLYVWIIPRTALNGRWYHALVNWVYTKERVASYELCEEYAKEPASYIYVRSGSSMHDISDVKSDAKKIGEFSDNYRKPALFSQKILLVYEYLLLQCRAKLKPSICLPYK